MYLLIDYRERDFIDKLSEFCIIENEITRSVKINGQEISIKITNLPIADFIITRDIHDNNTIKLAIERKSTNDLYSSIIDGRFREQKSRLLDSLGDVNKICYLIEGTTSKLITTNKINIVRGSITNLIFKHQYRVITTQNKSDTFDYILLLYKKYKNGEFLNEHEKREKEETEGQSSLDGKLIKLQRKCEKIENSKLLNQLCLIPGISPTIANAIILWLKDKAPDSSPSIKNIIDLYKEHDNILADIIISSNEKRVRKVGKALSKKIYQYFCT
jgi:ERCC4-type nuclease